MNNRKICPLLTNHAHEDHDGLDHNTAVHCQGDSCAWWDPAREKCVVYVGMKDLIAGINLIVTGGKHE